ncbi:MAG: polyphosphate kinase 1 [Bacteroidetes bacterium]|nr:polyphosphate kinase 1 [Bacteroidota bacterium]
MPQYSFYDRDMSWLTFNYRVLEEAAREDTPLLDRISFLSIFSSNLDEFYRVRIPALAALQKIKSTKETYISPEGIKLLTQISSRVNHQLEHFGQLLTQRILPALAAHGIRFVYAEPIPEPIREAACQYFFTQILAFLQPVYLTRDKVDFFPENDRLYFLVVLNDEKDGEQLVILNIPSDSLPRFFDTTVDDNRYILFIDDIIRENLSFLFPTATVGGIYSLKITRDAELDLEDEYEGDIADKIEKKLARRDAGLATRFLHEPGIPLRSLDTLVQRLGLDRASVMTGGRYHNLRDLSGFPVKDRSLSYISWPGLRPREDGHHPSLLQATMEKDLMLHTPYESYDPVLRFFNEAALDPFVEEIFLTMYRVAKDSRIVHALISACRNGKKVTVFVELKARFDEANNLRWARKMKEAGVRIIYSIPTLKVHAKIGLVKKKIDDRVHYAGLLATGNLNENTARFYTDHILLTGQHDLMRELELLFIFLCKRKEPRQSEKIAFQHLLVAQFNLQERFLALIDREIAYARQGNPAHITIKMNNLEERVLISKLYEASQAGVRIQLIVRSICCCIPGVRGMSENITIKRIVDRYLEHGRVFIFHNNGQEDIFMGSADWMNRNIYRRIEVCFPVYNPVHKEEIRNIIRLQLADTIAAVPIDAQSEQVPEDPLLCPENHPFTLPPIQAGVETDGPVRSQEAIYQYLAGLHARQK